jgi:hypothetical protein
MSSRLIEDDLFTLFPGPIEGDGRDRKEDDEEEGCGEGEGEEEGEIGVAVATIENKAEQVVDKQPCGGYYKSAETVSYRHEITRFMYNK